MCCFLYPKMRKYATFYSLLPTSAMRTPLPPISRALGPTTKNVANILTNTESHDQRGCRNYPIQCKSTHSLNTFPYNPVPSDNANPGPDQSFQPQFLRPLNPSIHAHIPMQLQPSLHGCGGDICSWFYCGSCCCHCFRCCRGSCCSSILKLRFETQVARRLRGDGSTASSAGSLHGNVR